MYDIKRCPVSLFSSSISTLHGDRPGLAAAERPRAKTSILSVMRFLGSFRSPSRSRHEQSNWLTSTAVELASLHAMFFLFCSAHVLRET